MMNETQRAVLVLDEATGKRISRLWLAEPYPKSQAVYLTIEFDDETEILIEVECQSFFRCIAACSSLLSCCGGLVLPCDPTWSPSKPSVATLVGSVMLT